MATNPRDSRHERAPDLVEREAGGMTVRTR
jgi:hypothetical protein